MNNDTYDQRLFNKIAPDYLKKDLIGASRIARKHRVKETFKSLPIQKHISILDVGCGAGFSAKYLEGLYSKYVGIDYSENLIQYARQYNSVKNATFLVDNIKEYKTDYKYDLIFLIGAVHHFDDAEATLSKIIELLQPKGWIVANEPQLANPLINVARLLRKKFDTKYSDRQHYFTYSEFFKLYKGLGLKNIMLRPQGIFSTPMAEIPMKPDSIFEPVARATVKIDKALYNLPYTVLKLISWNVIAIGQKSTI